MPRVRKNARANKKFVWRIAIYIRLSREESEESKRGKGAKASKNVLADASGSVVEQEKILTEWVKEHFSGEEFRIVDYFIDDGLTGTDDTRDNFQRMMEFVENGKVNCIVVKTLSRAFRNYADQGRYLEEIFPRKGVRFISTGNPFVDSYSNPEAIVGGMEIPINGLMNDRFAAKTSEDIRRTFDAKRSRGEFIGAFAPYGYLKNPEDKNSFIIDPDAAQHVRDIFHWFVADGMSKRGIALKLNELGVLNPTAYKQQILKLKYQNPGTKHNDGLWMGQNVDSILKNEVYIGNMVQGRHRVISYKVHMQVKVPEEDWYVVPGTHEAIIREEVFRKAQTLHARDTKTAPGKRQTSIFSGMLRCADCKKSMRRKTSKQLVYYHCRTVADKGEGACIKRSIREDKLMQAVCDAIRLQMKLIASLSETLDAIRDCPTVKTKSTRLCAMLKLRQEELEKITKASDSLYLDWKNGDISKEDYRRMKAAFDEKADTLKASVENIKDEINTLEKGVNADDPYLTAFLKFKNIQEINRGIIVELVDMIYIHADGQITIDFAFADVFKRVIGFTQNSRQRLPIMTGEAVS